MQSNRATIYSNGIADFQRVYKVTGDSTKISIPVRQKHLGDVLASLTISGDVKIVSPPSYQPANLDDGNIAITTANALTQLAHQLAGAEIKVTFGEQDVQGKLVGLQDRQIGTNGEPVNETSIVVSNNEGLSTIPINRVVNLRFLEESIQLEIDKALSRRLREIKPNSTFVDLELSALNADSSSETDAMIQYTIPAAAWKISYRILLLEDQKIELHGHAIVDNNTDEDWKNFIVSVVVGQPISFTTDLADSKTPRRDHVNIVQESAFGAVEVEETIPNRGFGMAGGMADADAYDVAAMTVAESDLMMPKSRSGRGRGGRPAKIEEAEVAESGDFCIFESSTPVSIDAHRSAVIPVLTTALDETKPVLHFFHPHNPDHPYRTIRFKNTTGHSLGRGVCTVYDGSTYAGNCILPSTKTDGQALLPHALETSVRVNQEAGQSKSRRVGIQIANGVVYESYHEQLEHEYVIENRRDEAFDFLLDHKFSFHDGEKSVTLLRVSSEPESLELEKLKQRKRRVEFTIGENETVKIKTSETHINKSRIVMAPKNGTSDISWLLNNVQSNTNLADDASVAKCIKIYKSQDEKQQLLEETTQEIQRLSKRQERLRENIKTGNADQQTAKWQSDLANAENKIVRLEEEVQPVLNAELKQLRSELFAATKDLAIEWREEK